MYLMLGYLGTVKGYILWMIAEHEFCRVRIQIVLPGQILLAVFSDVVVEQW